MKAIKIMGSKLAAKDAVKAYDIPMVPGIDEAITDVEKAKKNLKEFKNVIIEEMDLMQPESIHAFAQKFRCIYCTRYALD